MKIDKNFFSRDAEIVARELLGKVIVRKKVEKTNATFDKILPILKKAHSSITYAGKDKDGNKLFRIKEFSDLY